MRYTPADHNHETPYLSYRAGREFQILVADYMLRLQWALLGPDSATRFASAEYSSTAAKAGIGESIRKLIGGLLGPLLDDSISIKKTASHDDTEQAMFEAMRENWSPVLRTIERGGTALGWMAEYLTGRLKLPAERVRSMAMDDYDRALKEIPPELYARYDIDPSEPTELRAIFAGGQNGGQTDRNLERAYAAAYAEREGARWVAVYDENGERAGRAYEVISKLFRKQVAESIRLGEPLGQLRQRMVFPNLLQELERGNITENEYLEWTESHLNRDFYRFAFTETAYAFNNGRLSYMAKASGDRPVYVRFAPAAKGRGR